jgi:hypothetical protein
MKTLYTTKDGRTITLHWNSWFARAMALFRGVNMCVTPTASDVFVSRDWITAYALAHEVGHSLDAEARGLGYLPWILYCFLRYGYAGSPAEIAANAYADAHVDEFTNIGPVPGWVR